MASTDSRTTARRVFGSKHFHLELVIYKLGVCVLRERQLFFDQSPTAIKASDFFGKRLNARLPFVDEILEFFEVGLP